jgi:hypothetical protein
VTTPMPPATTASSNGPGAGGVQGPAVPGASNPAAGAAPEAKC